MKENDYKKIFMQESEELLQQMNSSLLSLEKNHNDEEAVNSIFRGAHTIKGMSASMNYKQIAELSTKMEDLLDKIRSKKIEIHENIINALFKAFDVLEKLVALVGDNKPSNIDINPVIILLQNDLVDINKLEEEKTGTELSLNKFDKRTLARVKRDGFSCYHIKIKLDEQTALKSVRAFMVIRNLHKIGEVIKSIPDANSINEEDFGFEFGLVFITKEKRDDVVNNAYEIMDVKDVKLENIEVDSRWEEEIEVEDSEAEKPESSEYFKKLKSVRIDINRLDKLMNLAEEITIAKLKLNTISANIQNTSLKNISEEIGRLVDELQEEIMNSRLIPVGQVFDRFPRLVRDIAKKEGKEIKFNLIGSDIELDRIVLDEISEPMIHLIRNAIDHGIETPDLRAQRGKPREGRIILRTKRDRNRTIVEVEDDGNGMDVESVKASVLKNEIVSKEVLNTMSTEEILFLATKPGVSTKKEVTDISGRGVGLDVVKEKAESMGGNLKIETETGKGTRFIVSLPSSTALLKALLVKNTGVSFAIPVSYISEIVAVDERSVKKVEHQETIVNRDRVLPIFRLNKLFSRLQTADIRPQTADKNRKAEELNAKLNIVVVESNDRQYGIVVDKLIGQSDIVVKQLSRELRGVKGFSGASILGDGSVSLVLDVSTLI